MFWLIAVLLFFIVGVGVFELVKQDAGYVLISFGSVTIETSFWFSLLVILIVTLCAVAVFYVSSRILSSLSSGSRWMKTKRALSIEKNYREALLHYLTDNYLEANQFFSVLSRKNGLPVVKAIASARSIMASGNAKKALSILDSAERTYTQDRPWLLKAKILIQLELNDESAARDTYRKLAMIAPEDSFVKKIAYRLAGESAETNTLALSSDVAISAQLSEPESSRLLVNAFRGLATTDQIHADEIERLWNKASKEQKQNAELQLAYVEALIAASEKDKASKFIEKTLSKHWHAGLLNVYAKTELSTYAKQLKKAESWRSLYSDQHAFYLSLGLLCIKNQYWGQARSYLEMSIKLQESSEAYYLLAHIAEKLGENDESFVLYKRSAELQKP